MAFKFENLKRGLRAIDHSAQISVLIEKFPEKNHITSSIYLTDHIKSLQASRNSIR